MWSSYQAPRVSVFLCSNINFINGVMSIIESNVSVPSSPQGPPTVTASRFDLGDSTRHALRNLVFEAESRNKRQEI